MLYLLLIPLILIIALLLLSIRLRIELSPNRQIVFVGLGRSGPELDLAARKGTLKIFGIRLKRFGLDRKTAKEEKPEKKAVEEVAEAPKVEKKRPRRRTRRPTIAQIRQILPQIASALWGYFISILKSVAVEEAQGKIEAGFDEPDITGRVFGYYQAALGMVPSVVGRVAFVPDWTGASFSASMRLSLALPLYKLVWRTLVLFVRLPLRELVKLAIGKKRGDEDV